MKPPSPAPAYAIVYPHLLKVARAHGYVLAIHGSMGRDLDLVAVPWEDEVSAPDVLAGAIATTVSGYYIGDWHPEPRHRSPEQKPHGRLSYAIHWDTGGDDYIDLSIMPALS